MNLLQQILVALIALEHIYILWLEMFAWNTPYGRKTFSSIPSDLFARTTVLAANQGLYNGFLAAGLIWALIIQDVQWSRNVALFFTSCVAVAGIYGGTTAVRRIFFVQALPALIALTSLLF